MEPKRNPNAPTPDAWDSSLVARAQRTTPMLYLSAPAQAAMEPTQPFHGGLEQLVERSLAQYFMTLGEALPAPGLYDRVLEQVERPLLMHTLRATRGNQIKAAEILGINRNTLRKKLRLLGIDSRAGWKEAA